MLILFHLFAGLTHLFPALYVCKLYKGRKE
nr:MAG TPA: hypothetical protein [Caudoviricetes sp.]DAM28206.1 MAG TPA: hypothetical protein [Caudoviricetes sp.]